VTTKTKIMSDNQLAETVAPPPAYAAPERKKVDTKLDSLNKRDELLKTGTIQTTSPLNSNALNLRCQMV